MQHYMIGLHLISVYIYFLPQGYVLVFLAHSDWYMVGASQTSINEGTLMEVLITIALGMGQMEQESPKQFISECVCVCACMSVSSHVNRYDSWKMCLRTTSCFLGRLPNHPSPFLADKWEEKDTGLMVDS